MSIFKSMELKPRKITVKGKIKKVLDLYRELILSSNALLTDFLAVKQEDLDADPLNAYAHICKSRGHKIESGMSAQETAFIIGAMGIMDQKPTDVISGAFYANKRNDTVFECGYLLRLLNNIIETDSSSCCKILCVNPSPDMIIELENYRSSKNEYYFACDLVSMTSSDLKPFKEILVMHKIIGPEDNVTLTEINEPGTDIGSICREWHFDDDITFVKDANTDEPLADVKVQFCSDTQCMMGKTDNTGATVFNVDPGNYQAHILKPPAGYQKNSETAELTAEDRVAVFKLLKEGEELKTADTADGADAKADETGEKSAGNDCQIIGICWDVEDDNVQEAIKILEDRGVTYPNICATDEMKKTLLSAGLPTTYFVDSEGKVLTAPVRGANFDLYRERLEEALKAVE